MRILRIVSAGYEQGGAENGIVLTNEELRKRGHTVKVLSARVEAKHKKYSDYEYAGVPNSGIKHFTYAAFNMSAYRVTKEILSKFKPDVVMLHTMSQPTSSVLFLLKNYPTIQLVHGPEIFTKKLLPWYLKTTDYRNESFALSSLTPKGWAHYIYYRFVCGTLYRIGKPNINAMVALSTYTEKVLSSEGYHPTYIPNGIRLFKRWPLPKRHMNLLYAGRLESYKGVSDLLNALPSILRKHPDATLEIAGTGTSKEIFEKQVKKLSISHSVKFLGQLTQNELHEAYKRCSIFVLPSRWPETFGKVAVEAMSVGRPVIATDVGGVRDWLVDGSNGFLINPGSPDEIAASVIQLAHDVNVAEIMAKNARITSEKFSIEAMTDSLERLALSLQRQS